MILNIGGGGGLPIRLIVTAPTGSAVSVTRGTTVLAANEVDGMWTFAIPSLGVWTIHATIEGQSLTQDVDISKVGQYNVTLEKPVSNTLNDNDWATIKEVADASEGANYWAVGDTKQITINGKLSDGLTLSNYQTWVYIIGFDHNSAVEGTGIAFGGFKTAQTSGIDVALCDSGYNSGKSSGQWFNMNNNNSTSGGWASCDMRNTTLPAVKAALPADLTSVIKTTNIYTDNTGNATTAASNVTATQDELYLLAEFEIFGARSYANSAERNHQQQYAYYVAGNSKIKYRHDSTATTVFWFERSVSEMYVREFCGVNANGTADHYDARYSEGLAVAFKVGGAKYTPVEYIQSTGTQHLDTLFKPNNHTRVVIDFRSTFSTANSPKGLLGSRNSSDIGMFAFLYSNRIDPNYNGVGKSITVDSLQRHVYDFNQNSFSVDGAAVSFDAGVFSPGYNLILLSIQNYGTIDNRKAEGYLYSCQIYDNGTIVRDFIPAKDEVGNAGLYDKVEGKFYYNAGTGSFRIPGVRTIDSASVGQSVYCNVNNTKKEFIIVHQGKPSGMYDDSCDGTWLLMKDIYEERQWNSSTDNIYGASTIHSYLNSTFLNRLDIKDVIKQVKIPYVNGWGSAAVASGANGLSAKVFLLSGYEVGLGGAEWVPQDGAKLSYFNQNAGKDAKRIAYLYGSTTAGVWWLRSAHTNSNSTALVIVTDGAYSYPFVNDTKGVRPAFIVPSDTYIDEDNNILTAPPYNAISALNVGDSVFCREDGVNTEYLLVHKGLPSGMYDASCNGAWLLKKDVYDNSAWNSSNKNSYKTSTIHSYLNSTFLNLLDIKDVIRQAKIPYVDGTGGSAVASGVNGLSTKVFLLSGYEVGWTTASDDRNLPQDGVKLDYFIKSSTGNSKRIANFNGAATSWWLRSPITGSSSNVFLVHSSGSSTYNSATRDYGIRPAFIVPLDTPIDSSNNIIA